jgi:hypothetical protein
MRVSQLMLVLLIAAALPGAEANAQANEGTVLVEPALSQVGLTQGTLDLEVKVQGLDHHGSVPYDNNNDGTPDRFLSSNGLGAFEFTLTFDPAIVGVEQAELGNELDGTGRYSCLQRSDAPGSFSFGCVSNGLDDGPQGTLTLANITFGILRAGTSHVALEAQLSGPLSNDDVPVAVKEGGWITVAGPPGATAPPRTSVRPTATPPFGTPDPDATDDNGSGNGPRATSDDVEITPGATDDPSVSAGPGDTNDGPGGEGNGASSGAESGGGPSAGSIALWTLLGIGGLGAASAAGFSALRWRHKI